jgi:hypothetical protein
LLAPKFILPTTVVGAGSEQIYVSYKQPT